MKPPSEHLGGMEAAYQRQAEQERLERLQDGPFRCGCHAASVFDIDGIWHCPVTATPARSVHPDDEPPEARAARVGGDINAAIAKLPKRK